MTAPRVPVADLTPAEWAAAALKQADTAKMRVALVQTEHLRELLAERDRMTGLLAAADFTRLVIDGGDKVLVQLKRDDFTAEQVQQIAAELTAYFDGYPCIVVPPGVELATAPSGETEGGTQ